MEKEERIQWLLSQLNEKMESVGEDMADHLEGLLYSYYENYWDYIGIDALLNLQKPKTKYQDEMTFIIYHQITELYFKLILHEFEIIGFTDKLTSEKFVKHLDRINYYFDYLVESFNVLIKGMDRDQFMRFRTAITPASGFQSIQYRLIELWCTKFINLVSHDYRHLYDDTSFIKEMYQHLHWRQGAINKENGSKTLTLIQFEEKYGNLIIRKGKEFLDKNLLVCYEGLSEEDRQDPKLIEALRTLDANANINWPLAHFKNATRYLVKNNVAAKSTGNTNWQQYLPPKFQKQVFYPALWSEEEKGNWGKAWVDKVLNETTTV